MSDVIQFPSQDALLEISVVKELLAELAEAFPGGSRSKDVTNLLRVYRQNLAGVSEAAARGAVRSIVRNDERFPSVSRLRAAAHEWTRRNVASPEYQIRHDPNVCQSCRQPFVTQTRWRPQVVDGSSMLPPGSLALTPDHAAVYLERYVRDVCGCHVACEYTPDERPETLDRYGDRPTMPIAMLPEFQKLRVLDQLSRKRGAWKATTPAQPLADAARQIAAGAGV